MSCRRAIVWFVMLFLAASSTSSVAQTPSAQPVDAWGKAVRGLQIAVRPAKKQFAPGESPVVYIILRNTGDEDLKLSLGQIWPGGGRQFGRQFQLLLTDASGKTRKLSLAPLHHASAVRNPLVVALPRGTTYPIEVRLDECYEPLVASAVGKLRIPEGKYRITATYSRIVGDDLHGAWTGTVTSQPVAFEVKDRFGEPDDLINLARLGIAGVSAGPVNGSRRQDDKYYGVLNMFDDGEHFINNINYTSFLSEPSSQHLVIVTFNQHPVELHSVHVETVDQWRPRTLRIKVGHLTKDRKQQNSDYDAVPVKPGVTKFVLPKPLERVNYVHVWFASGTVVQIAEIRVNGRPPKGIDLTPRTPILTPLAPIEAHKLQVTRSAQTDVAKRCLKLAEEAYPRREDVLKVYRAFGLADSSVPPQKLWWYTTHNGVRIPYAITGEAVGYYERLIKGYRERKWPTGSHPQSRLEYSARANLVKRCRHESHTFEDVYVVRMYLDFHASWSKSQELRFQKERTVIVHPSGEVLASFGDGKTKCTVK